MLSVQSATQPQPPKLGRPELAPLTGTRSPSPLPASTPAPSAVVPPSPGPGLDQWFQELQKYEATLGAMAAAHEDPKFREELGTIEQWFKLLNESEQTASLYTLLQHANESQVKFLAAVITQMSTANAQTDNKPKTSGRSLRPPSLNIPLNSPATPLFTPASAIETDKLIPGVPEQAAQDVPVKHNWANEVSTPLVRMFPKGSEAAAAAANANAQTTNTTTNGTAAAAPAAPPSLPNLPGMPVLNPYNMAILNQMGYSNEAQLLAVQMVMSGLVQPSGINLPGTQKGQHPFRPAQKPSAAANWRSPASAKYPTSALRTGGLKTSGLKSSGLRSAGPKSATPLASAGATPKDSEDIDPEMLKDVPAWLKSLRLHKYTICFEGMTWEDMVILDEPTLEAKGVAALGARRRLTKTFELVKRKMGMDSTPTASDLNAPPASAVLPTINTNLPRAHQDLKVPHSAAPTFASS